MVNPSQLLSFNLSVSESTSVVYSVAEMRERQHDNDSLRKINYSRVEKLLLFCNCTTLTVNGQYS